MPTGPAECRGELGDGTALPDDAEVGLAVVLAHSHHDLADHRS